MSSISPTRYRCSLLKQFTLGVKFAELRRTLLLAFDTNYVGEEDAH